MNEILKNNSFKYHTHGSYGAVFSNHNNTIILKIILIGEDFCIDSDCDYYNVCADMKLFSTTMSEFTNEVETQQYVYSKSLGSNIYGQICPEIYDYACLNYDDPQLSSLCQESIHMVNLCIVASNFNFKLGLIAMEFITEIEAFNSGLPLETITISCCFASILLVILTGIHHVDCHTSNICIDPKKPTHVKFIDFGKSIVIPPQKHRIMLESFHKKQYCEILFALFEKRRTHPHIKYMLSSPDMQIKLHYMFASHFAQLKAQTFNDWFNFAQSITIGACAIVVLSMCIRHN